MFVVSCRAELGIIGAQSLKDKRRVIRSVVERLRSRFNAAVSEVDQHDVWQQATLGLAVVALTEGAGRRSIEQMLRHIEGHVQVELRQTDIQVY